MLSDSLLIEENKRGLILAPGESEESFLLRCKQAKKKEASPYSKRAAELFDINPDWVDVHFSNQNLRLWEGGCTWIDSKRVTLQLRKTFENKARYLGYSREEILAHELVHVVRGNFEEPIFEEILAYQSSSSCLRRFLGPIFRSSKESIFFLLSLLAVSFAPVLPHFQRMIYLGAIAIFGGGMFRLSKAQLIFTKTRKKMAQIVGKDKALAVMLRLTDREIIRFSKMEKDQIVCDALKLSRTQMRWQQIILTYLT